MFANEKGFWENIKRDAKERAKIGGELKSNLYIENIPFKVGHTINAGPLEINIDRPTVMIFVDDKPFYNWSHPCRYFLYDMESGDSKPYKKIDARFPPHIINPPDSFSLFQKQVKIIDEPIFGESLLPESTTFIPFPGYNIGGERYALLFSGDSYSMHVNDLEYLYRILIELYAFKPENIFVLNFDGTYIEHDNGTRTPNYSHAPWDSVLTVWPGNGTPYKLKILPKKASNENLLEVFNDLKVKVTVNDLLFIHTNNHGALINNDSESALVTYPADGHFVTFSASEFAEQVAALGEFAELVVMMEQCHSGGFRKPVLQSSRANRTVFIAACEKDEESRQGIYFDIFTKAWSKQISGYVATAYGTSGSGSVGASPSFVKTSVQKAYTVACNTDNEDSPVFGNTPDGTGENMFLGFPELMV